MWSTYIASLRTSRFLPTSEKNSLLCSTYTGHLHTQTWHMHTDTTHTHTQVCTQPQLASYEDNVTLSPNHSSALNSWDLASYCLSGFPTIMKLPVELGIIKARGFSHVLFSLKLYLWVSCAALTIVHWLQFYPEIFYINIGLAQGSVLSSLPSLFYIFFQSSHSFSSLIMTLLCIPEQRSGDWYIKGT